MIHIPYTYLITHIPSGMKYYGVRYAKNCSPEDLWKTYFTSSTKIKKLIEKDGKNAFVAQIRKTFTNDKDAILWETRVLTKLKIPYNTRYLNKGKNHPLSQSEKEEAMFREYGVKNAMQSPDIRKKATATIIQKYGVDNVAKSSDIKEQKRMIYQDRYGVNSSWEIDGVLEKSKATRMEKYGAEWSMQSKEIKEKSKQTQFEKFGDWKCNTNEAIDSRKDACLKKYGVDNPFKVKGLVSDIIKEKYGVANWFQTNEGKESIRQSWEKRDLMECPHCGKTSKAYSNMKRWHFDNCKNRKE
jgi:hypothetical protein